ncbi:hypothetical protein AGR8A_pTi20031 [Agrobacterium fabrum str. J-07]|nr:hypothetical protein AGR8A_pTi20031 [Agrobacterium fabrum str. J-07]
MFTFSVTDVRIVMMRGRIDAYRNGGFRNPHYGLYPGRDEQPGVWLVGDEGVYLLSNGDLAEGQRPLSMPKSAIRRPTRTTGITSVSISGAMTAWSSSRAPCS